VERLILQSERNGEFYEQRERFGGASVLVTSGWAASSSTCTGLLEAPLTTKFILAI
jgi:hypothetical protein